MRITFVTRKFGNVERNSHCDVLHITPIRVARLFLDCNGDFAIKAYSIPFVQNLSIPIPELNSSIPKGIDISPGNIVGAV